MYATTGNTPACAGKTLGGKALIVPDFYRETGCLLTYLRARWSYPPLQPSLGRLNTEPDGQCQKSPRPR